jgi:hypothetical protein
MCHVAFKVLPPLPPHRGGAGDRGPKFMCWFLCNTWSAANSALVAAFFWFHAVFSITQESGTWVDALQKGSRTVKRPRVLQETPPTPLVPLGGQQTPLSEALRRRFPHVCQSFVLTDKSLNVGIAGVVWGFLTRKLVSSQCTGLLALHSACYVLDGVPAQHALIDIDQRANCVLLDELLPAYQMHSGLLLACHNNVHSLCRINESVVLLSTDQRALVKWRRHFLSHSVYIVK